MPQFVNKELTLPLLPKGALCKQRFDVTQAWQTPVLLLCLSCTWSRYQLTERKMRLAILPLMPSSVAPSGSSVQCSCQCRHGVLRAAN